MLSMVVITGAGSGLGLELARWYAARGDRVVGVVRSEEGTERFAGATGAAGRVVRGDVTSSDCCDRLRQVLRAEAPVVDLLFNNAGMSGRGPRLAEIDPRDVQEAFEVHCLAALRVVQAALDSLRAAARPTIVNVSSRLGSISGVAAGEFDKLGIAYASRISKAAQNMLSVCMHRELAPHGIAVYAVHPGRLTTRMASADADLAADVAAERLARWLERVRSTRLLFYGEPDVTEFAW